jgi:hypothetical protein
VIFGFHGVYFARRRVTKRVPLKFF